MAQLKYLFSFKGRVRRRTWWISSALTIVFMLICKTVLDVASALLRLASVDFSTGHTAALAFIILVAFISKLAFDVRRLHDINGPGWLVALVFVPPIGPLFNLVVMGAVEGTNGPTSTGRPSNRSYRR